MRKNIIFSVLISVILTSCASTLSSSYTKEGYNGENYRKIAVIGMSNDLNARLAFENKAVDLLKENNINAVVGVNMFPQKMPKEAQTPENYIQIIKDNNLDGILTISLIDVNDSHRYQTGQSYSVPAGYYRVGKYIYRRYVTINEPGYYVPTKSYVLEAVFYNLKGELTTGKDTWVWTGESSLVDPSSLQSAANNFCNQLINQIVKDGVILFQE
jgi:hypothetical protein